jgi:hypothetical protein
MMVPIQSNWKFGLPQSFGLSFVDKKCGTNEGAKARGLSGVKYIYIL